VEGMLKSFERSQITDEQPSTSASRTASDNDESVPIDVDHDEPVDAVMLHDEERQRSFSNPRETFFMDVDSPPDPDNSPPPTVVPAKKLAPRLSGGVDPKTFYGTKLDKRKAPESSKEDENKTNEDASDLPVDVESDPAAPPHQT
jgi:hypothetical protein